MHFQQIYPNKKLAEPFILFEAEPFGSLKF